MPVARAFLFKIFLAVFRSFNCKYGGGSCRCVKRVTHTYFHFFAYINCNTGAVATSLLGWSQAVASQADFTYMLLLFCL